MPKLYVMIGIPGAGKSYYVKHHLGNLPVVSRDEIRFSITGEDEHYHAYEKQVFSMFVNGIVEHLKNDESVVADATHVSKASRRKLLWAIDKYIRDYQIVYVVIDTNLAGAIRHNAMRQGREHVPYEVIERFHDMFEFPYVDEDDRISEIIIV